MQLRNRVRARIAADEAALGVVVRSFSPVVVELIGLSGFDYVWIDLEHGSASYETAEALVRAADSVAIDSMIRIPDKSPASVLRALETGAGLICVPQVETRQEAEAIAHAARFHPRGGRGYTTASRGTRYGFGASGQALLDRANEQVTVVAQIESIEGLRNARAIAAVPGIDVLFAGLGDLSQQMGKPGAVADPELLAAGRSVMTSAHEAGKQAGIMAGDAASIRHWMALGARLFYCAVDLTLIAQALRNLRSRCDQSPSATDVEHP